MHKRSLETGLYFSPRNSSNAIIMLNSEYNRISEETSAEQNQIITKLKERVNLIGSLKYASLELTYLKLGESFDRTIGTQHDIDELDERDKLVTFGLETAYRASFLMLDALQFTFLPREQRMQLLKEKMMGGSSYQELSTGKNDNNLNRILEQRGLDDIYNKITLLEDFSKKGDNDSGEEIMKVFPDIFFPPIDYDPLNKTQKLQHKGCEHTRELYTQIYQIGVDNNISQS